MNLAKGRSVLICCTDQRNVPSLLGVLFAMIVSWLVIPLSQAEAKLLKQVVQAPIQEKDANAEPDEDASYRRMFTQVNTTFVPAPRELTRPLMRARRAIEENELSRAAELIGEFLINSPEQDYLVAGRSKSNKVSVSLRELAETMLSELPAEALKSYRVRYGIPARHQLEAAISNRDDKAVGEVAMRYFHTEAGHVATMLVGHRELQLGNPISAAASFNKLIRSEDARKRFDPELSILFATTLSMAGETELAREHLEAFRKRSKSREIQFDGRRVSMFEPGSDPMPWLIGLIGRSELKRSPLVNEWLIEGGNPQRNAISKTGMPFRAPKWSLKLNPNDSTTPAVPSSTSSMARMPMQHPMSIGETITLSKLYDTFGIDFATGKRKWRFPPILDEASNGGLGTASFFVGNAAYSKASDGSQLFLVDAPSAKTNAASNRFQALTGPKYNSLVSLELAGQGRMAWRVGQPTAVDSNVGSSQFDSTKAIGNVQFLGPPLPLGNELYVIADLEQTIQLLALDRNTGQLNWKQHLAVKESSNRFQSYRSTHAISPSYDNGVLVCPTGTGALVAIDLSTRLFLWGHQYLQGRASSSMNWIDSRLIIEDGKIYYGAAESRRLHVFDLESGEALGTASANLGTKGLAYLAAVVDQNAIVVGNDYVQSIAIRGAVNWSVKLGEFGTPSGRGFLADGHYIFPTSDRFVLKVRLSDGKVVDQVETSTVLGNLVSYRGAILSHSSEELACYNTDVTAESEIKLALEELGSPEELPARIQRLRIQLKAREGKWVEALQALEYVSEAEQVAIDSHQLASLLSFMLLDRENDLAPLIEKYWPMLTLSDQRQLRTSLIEYWIGSGNHRRAVNELLAWARTQSEKNEFIATEAEDRDKDAFYISKRLSEFDAGSGRVRNASIDRLNIRVAKVAWFRSVLKRVLTVDPSVRTQIRAEIESKMNETDAWRDRYEYLQRFPPNAVPVQLRRELVTSLVGDRDLIRANRLLLSLVGFDLADRLPKSSSLDPLTVNLEDLKLWIEFQLAQNQSIKAKKVVMLAQDGRVTLRHKGQLLSDEARQQVLASLVEEMEDARIPMVDNAGHSQAQPLSRWQEINQVSTQVNSIATISDTLLPVTFEGVSDTLKEQFTAGVWNSEHALEFFEANGESIRKFSVPKFSSTSFRERPFLRHNDSMVVLQRGRNLVGIDLQKVWQPDANPVVWDYLATRSFGKLSATTSRKVTSELLVDRIDLAAEKIEVGKVSANGICFAEPGVLKCIDPVDGRMKWTRPLAVKRPILLGDDDWVVVVDVAAQRAEVFDIESARFVKSLELPKAFRNVWERDGLQATTLALFTGDDIDEFEKLRLDWGHANKKTNSKNAASGASGDTSKPSENSQSKNQKPRLAICRYDFRSESFIWTRLLNPDAKATRLSERRFVVLTDLGNLKICDSLTGERLSQIKLRWHDGERKQVRYLGSVKMGAEDLLVFHAASEASSSFSAANYISIRRVNSYEVMLSGSMMLIDRESNSPVWRNRIRLTGASYAPFSPANSPVLLFHRRIQSSSTSRRTLPQSHHVIGIHRTTGQELFRSLRPTVAIQFRGATKFEPKAGELQMRFNSGDLTLKLEQIDGLPPRPVAWIDRNNALLDKGEPRGSKNSREGLVQRFEELKQRIKNAERLQKVKAANEKAKLEAEFGIEFEK